MTKRCEQLLVPFEKGEPRFHATQYPNAAMVSPHTRLDQWTHKGRLARVRAALQGRVGPFFALLPGQWSALPKRVSSRAYLPCSGQFLVTSSFLTIAPCHYTLPSLPIPPLVA